MDAEARGGGDGGLGRVVEEEGGRAGRSVILGLQRTINCAFLIGRHRTSRLPVSSQGRSTKVSTQGLGKLHTSNEPTVYSI